MKIIVDGNDGTGKSTLVKSLLALGYDVSDRGIPTKMTDDDKLEVDDIKDTVYIILDATVEESRKRLALAGKDLNEKYHTVEDLTYYRDKYFDVWDRLFFAGCMITLISTTTRTQEQTLEAAVKRLKQVEELKVKGIW